MTKNAILTPTARKSCFRPASAFAFAFVALLSLGACGLFGGGNTQSSYPTEPDNGTGKNNPNPSPNAKSEGIFGEGGITLFGGGGGSSNQASAGIGVNTFLWRASLDTIAFMPLSSADPFGGVIISDWYQNPKAPNERFKLTVYILDRNLRADGVKVAVFRQLRDPKSGWIDASVDPQTGIKIENAILVRARQLHINELEADKK